MLESKEAPPWPWRAGHAECERESSDHNIEEAHRKAQAQAAHVTTTSLKDCKCRSLRSKNTILNLCEEEDSCTSHVALSFA
jgi:hypothetical protein